MRVGLRFARTDANTLQELAVRLRRGEIPGDVATFELAADAARTGEPLIVQCEHPAEAIAMADGYTRFGVRRPAVEELTGQRPSR